MDECGAWVEKILKRFVLTLSRSDENFGDPPRMMVPSGLINEAEFNQVCDVFRSYYFPNGVALRLRMRSVGCMRGAFPTYGLHVLTECAFSRRLQLRSHLPETLRYSDWVLMFNTETDGVSLTNLYRQVKSAGPLILFIKDEAGYVCCFCICTHQPHADSNRLAVVSLQVFGAFLSNELRLSDRTFYGSGDTFVFNIQPRARVYPWTGENEYFIKCELDQFHLGAGEYVIGPHAPCQCPPCASKLQYIASLMHTTLKQSE